MKAIKSLQEQIARCLGSDLGRGKIRPQTDRQRTRAALLGFALVSGLFFYGFRIVRVQGHSMEPAYHDGQWLLVRRLNWPSPPLGVGDVVVFRIDHDLLVKRIAAIGGQQAPIRIRKAALLFRPWYERPDSSEGAAPLAPGGVPEGQFFVLGDNRDNSEDSRHFGPVPLSALVGRAVRWNDPGRPRDP